MSNRAWKRTRLRLRPIYRHEAARARAAIKCPRWRLLLATAGFKGFARRWLDRETSKVERALKVAEKRTAHALVGHTVMGNTPGRDITWRAGPPPPPGARG